MNNEFKDFTAQLRELMANAECGGLDWKTGCKSESPYVVSYCEEFDSLAIELFALQFKHNAPYRRFCEARGATPEKINSWNQIPAAPTSAFKELELSCLPVAERTKVFHSSGTTEHRPSRHYHNADSLAIYEESVWAGFLLSKMGDGRWKMGCEGTQQKTRLLILTPPPKQAPHSSLVHMFETLRRRYGSDDSAFTGVVDKSGGWTLDFDATIQALRKAEESRVALRLLGTAFSYVHLMDSLAEQKLIFKLPSGSWAIETGGYKGRSRDLPKAELHSLITRQLGIPRSDILCEYGMSELSSQAYDGRWKMEDGRWEEQEDRCFYFPSWARAHIISPETGLEVADGETGLIRVFDLANVYSVMAVQTEDLAIRRGDGFELIGRAVRAEPRGCSLQAV